MKKDRIFWVINFSEAERAELVEALEILADVRHDALLKLADVMNGLKKPEPKQKEPTRPIKLGLPPELLKAMNSAAKRLKMKKKDLLIYAAREVSRQNSQNGKLS